MRLKEQKEQKVTQQQSILNGAKTAQRELTAEEQTELESLQRDISILDMLILAREDETEGAEKVNEAAAELEAERTRAAEITELCREFKMEADEYIKTGKSADQVRKAIIENMAQERTPIASRGNADISIKKDEEDKFREAAVDALLMRGGIEVENSAPGAKNMLGMSLRELAISTLQKENSQSDLSFRSQDEIYGMLQRAFYNPTSAFPTIMDNAINKAYVEGHKTANVTFDKFTKRGVLKDFKTHDNNYLAGPAGEFLEVPEGGELKHDTPKDTKRPTRKLKTYGRQFTMTRQAFINDDIDFLSKIPAKYAASARKTLNKQVYRIMIENEAIYDGTPLFSAAHKNIVATGTGITRESMQIMIMALQTQLDEFGEAIIINPAAIIVPAGYAFEVYTMFYSPTINSEGNTQAVNPLYRYRESIEVIEDPTINVLCGGFGKQMPWWLVGSKADTDFIEVDYLNGQEVPTIRRAETPGQLGFVWDIFIDWGVSVMDYRGAIKNQGTIVKDPLQ